MMSMKPRGLGLFCCVAALLAPGVLTAQSITIHPGRRQPDGTVYCRRHRTREQDGDLVGERRQRRQFRLRNDYNGRSLHRTRYDPGQRDHNQRARLGWDDFRDCVRGRRTRRAVDLVHFPKPNSSWLLYDHSDG
jgi:hypothetical protein